MHPKFRFLADSDAAANKAGLATWTYAGNSSGMTLVHQQRFTSFDEAHAMNNVIIAAYAAGRRYGDDRVCQAVSAALAEFRDV